jgi:hypothetical protein
MPHASALGIELLAFLDLPEGATIWGRLVSLTT